MAQRLLLAAILVQVCCAEIKISRGPQNTSVYEGEVATFECIITGSQDMASWYIDDNFYNPLYLPPRHSFWSGMLNISNVTLSDDGTAYQCVLIAPMLVSDTAILTVLQGSATISTNIVGGITALSAAPQKATEMDSTKAPHSVTSRMLAASLTDDVIMQLSLIHTSSCTRWINVDKMQKLEKVALKLDAYIEQRCNCTFPSTLITRAHFTCPPSQPSPPHPQHVTYRASISATGQLNRSMLEAVLREWPTLHRAILLQRELLSVDHTCPVIISSFQEEECSGDTPASMPVTVPLATFIGSIICIVGVTILLSAVVTALLCAKIRKQFNRRQPAGAVNRLSHMTSHDPAFPSNPEYEEIQELRETLRREGSGASDNEHAQRGGDYEFTHCPAYTISGSSYKK